jgi:hypothetical protein
VNWASLVPNFPDSYTAWDGLTTLLFLAVFKLFRGTRMKRRSRYVDRMGWSIIIYDLIFGAVFAFASIWTLYPQLYGGVWTDHIVNAILKVITAWQFYETWNAPEPRVEAAISGTVNGDDTMWEAGKSAERRKGYRRLSDEQMASDATAYRQGVNRMQGGV